MQKNINYFIFQNLTEQKWKILLIFCIFFVIFSAKIHAENVPEMAKSEPASAQFLVLTDLHFDPYSACGNQKPCVLIEKLRAARAEEWGAILAKYAKTEPVYREDTNYALLTSALSAAKNTAEKQKVQFGLVLGDFLAHRYKKYFRTYSSDRSPAAYVDFVRKTLRFITLELNKSFPNISLYAAIGNNDSYKNNYIFSRNNAFFPETANLFAALMKKPMNANAMRNSFSNAGYYAVDVGENNAIRLIVLNTVLFSHKAKGDQLASAITREFSWLAQELQTAKNRQQKILIAMHIPPDIDIYASMQGWLLNLVHLWKRDDVEKFNALMKMYAPQIMGILAGHLHSDWSYTWHVGDQALPVIGTPAISAIYGNNPGYKLFFYSPETLTITHTLTYYLPLTEGRPWGLEYDFRQIHQNHCHECMEFNKEKFLQSIGNISKFYRLFYAPNTEKMGNDVVWKAYYWCTITEGNQVDQQEMCN